MRAMLWEREGDNKISCRLCAHACRLPEGAHGRCGVRVNVRGELISLVGDVVTAAQLDPVEKKPLYHFLPGTKTFSVGSAGCNFRCRFCQNHQIAHVRPDSTIPGKRATPDTLCRLAARQARSMAFTYNEPTVFFEQVYETAGLAQAHGLKVILVSNGFMSEDFLLPLSRRVNAANIDLKGFSDEFYHTYCGGRLQPVLDNLKAIRKLGWWLEVTTLIIPGINDSADELRALACFIRDELGADTPWHVTGFHGAARMATHPATPLFQLEDVWRLGREQGLNHVYIGNAASILGGTTLCPSCGAALIERRGYQTRVRGTAGICPSCKTEIPGVWQ